MIDFAGLYYQIIAGSSLFIMEQILLLIALYKDKAGWKFRFSKVEDYSNLRPVQATWRVAVVIFAISIVTVPIIGVLIFDSLVSYVKSLQYNFLILVSFSLGAFFLIWHYGVGKDLNIQQGLLLILEFLILGILFYINYAR